MRSVRIWAGAWLACLVLTAVRPVWAAEATPERTISILQLRVVDGEGGVHPAGSRSAQILTIQVTDETGRPVPGADVSFRLPEEGPSGLFPNGLRTELVKSGVDGRAMIRGIRWGSAAGPVQLRIVAAKDKVRAGIFSSQYVSNEVEAKGSAKVAPVASSGKSRTKWILLGLAAAGAAGGLAMATHSGGSAGSSAPATTATSTTGVQIGAPSITVGGHP